MNIQNKVQLITYPDSLGNNLSELIFVLDNYIKYAIGGIHILPFYPSSHDRGFSPLTHLEVDSKFGTWDDIKKIASKYDLMVDLMINHISSESKYFQDYLKNNQKSKYKNLFLTTEDVFKGGKIIPSAITKIYRPRPSLPFTEYRFSDGTTKKMWTSFTENQVDLNWSSKETKKLIQKFLTKLDKSGTKIIRLDAAGYIVKKIGTNCFFLPQVYDIIDELKQNVTNNIKMLPEVHFNYKLQKQIAQKQDYVYDFALPMLVLHTLYTSNAKALKKWIKIRPNNCFTTLDTHDGIGTIDVKGLLTKEELDIDLTLLYKFEGNAAICATGESSDNLDIYQINCTYYSALGKNDKAYLCARAIQFFIPGIPQIYYVGLLAGENDIKLLNKTKNGRDINRHYYSIEEIKKNLKRDVVKKLFQLMKLRNTHPAFNGEFILHKSQNDILKLSWVNKKQYCTLKADLKTYDFEIEDSIKQENKITLIKKRIC